MKRLFRYLLLSSTAILLVAEGGTSAQNTSHLNYDFAAAKRLYKADKAVADSAKAVEIEALMMQCDNGSNMLHYACQPTVVTSKTVSIKDFHLYFSQMKDKVWIPVPNDFTGQSRHSLYNATYFDKNSKAIYFSKPGEDGHWNIYRSTCQGDTLWSVPTTLSDALVSSGDEIFPILSSDGRKLYFSSNGMAGMGGYDIFVSELCADGISWSAPVNVGFPYSSTGDDFLYYDTPDGKFTMLASNRDCSKDSVTIYVLAFEANSIRKSIDSPVEARKIAALKKQKTKKTEATAIKDDGGEFAKWYGVLNDLAIIKDSIAQISEDLSALREDFATAGESEKQNLAQRIGEKELSVMDLQSKMKLASEKVRAVEATFIENGITPPQIKKEEAVSDDTQELSYTFSKNSSGKAPEAKIAQAEPEFDYGFKVGKTAVIVEDNTLPDGICFQAQLCAVSQRLSLKKLRGLSPVYEVKQKTGKYIYYAGLFKTYEEATAALPKVKKCGFSGAYVVAFKDGKSIAVKTAKNLQNK